VEGREKAKGTRGRRLRSRKGKKENRGEIRGKREKGEGKNETYVEDARES